MNTFSTVMQSGALACVLGAMSVVSPAGAQQNLPRAQPGPTGASVVKRDKFVPISPVAPGSLLKSPIAIQRLPRGPRITLPLAGAQSRAAQPLLTGMTGDPVLFSSLLSYNGSSSVDPLWLFPTTGYNPANNLMAPSLVPSTLETTPNWTSSTPAGGNAPPASPNNINTIFFGQTGEADQITEMFVFGGLFDMVTHAAQVGTIQVTFYDGASPSQPPVDSGAGANIATTVGGHPAVYTYQYTSATSGTSGFGGPQLFDWVLSDPPKLTNANGKFGVRIAKITDSSLMSPSTTVWVWSVGLPNGNNAYWENQLSAGTYVSKGLITEPCTNDGFFNQSFQSSQDPQPADATQPANATVLNIGLELHGKTAAGGVSSRGVMQGNLRMQGVYKPINPLPNGATQTVEEAPGSYTLTFYQAGTSTQVLQQRLFTQPSFNADGSLTVNYILSGVPAGTYDVSVRHTPVYYFPASYPASPPVFGDGGPVASYWATAQLSSGSQYDATDGVWYIPYPYADWYTDTIRNVTIANGATATLNARLTRFWDLTDNGTYNAPDGVVDINDFGLFANVFGLSSGSSGFIAAADMVGSPTPAGVFPNGMTYYDDLPDGTVDINDFGAFALMFGTGNLESP